MILKLKLKLLDIDKTKIYTSPKTGEKYLDLVLMDTREPGPYGDDGFAAHDQTKEERADKAKLQYVGNWSWIVWPGERFPGKSSRPSNTAPRGDLGKGKPAQGSQTTFKATEEASDDVPF